MFHNEHFTESIKCYNSGCGYKPITEHKALSLETAEAAKTGWLVKSLTSHVTHIGDGVVPSQSFGRY